MSSWNKVAKLFRVIQLGLTKISGSSRTFLICTLISGSKPTKYADEDESIFALTWIWTLQSKIWQIYWSELYISHIHYKFITEIFQKITTVCVFPFFKTSKEFTLLKHTSRVYILDQNLNLIYIISPSGVTEGTKNKYH